MTPAQLRGWRLRYGLRVREMAHFVGVDESTIRRKEKGRAPISRRMERQTEMGDLLVAAGIIPPGWPQRLQVIVVYRRFPAMPENGR